MGNAGFFTIPVHQNIHIYLEANGKCLKSSLWTRFSRESFSFLLMIISLMWCNAKEICFKQICHFTIPVQNVHKWFKSSFFELFSHRWCVLNKIWHFWPIMDWYVRAVVAHHCCSWHTITIVDISQFHFRNIHIYLRKIANGLNLHFGPVWSDDAKKFVLNKTWRFWPIVDWYVRAVVCSPLL